MVQKNGTPFRRLAGARRAPALASVLALGTIGADRTLGAEDVREVFDILDANGDGAVTRQEFMRKKVEVFDRFLKGVGSDQHLDPADINITAEAFAKADQNGDGRLSGAEFVRAPFSRFESIDMNGDHEVTFEEFRDFVRRFQL